MLPESIEKERRIGALQRESFRRAYLAGARMAFGTDGGVYPHGENARQFALMGRLGMNAADAIRSATTNAAELLGWPDRVGNLKPGMYADLIAVEGDPLQDLGALERVRFVMKGSFVVRNDLR
jgi:imidazolonepropionase-like amidohydrolase